MLDDTGLLFVTIRKESAHLELDLSRFGKIYLMNGILRRIFYVLTLLALNGTGKNVSTQKACFWYRKVSISCVNFSVHWDIMQNWKISDAVSTQLNEEHSVIIESMEAFNLSQDTVVFSYLSIKCKSSWHSMVWTIVFHFGSNGNKQLLLGATPIHT